MKIMPIRKLDYHGEAIYVGIDVHKKNWGICVLSEHLEQQVVSQPPRSEIFVNYLHKHFPNTDYYSAYEAGFKGLNAYLRPILI